MAATTVLRSLNVSASPRKAVGFTLKVSSSLARAEAALSRAVRRTVRAREHRNEHAHVVAERGAHELQPAHADEQRHHVEQQGAAEPELHGRGRWSERAEQCEAGCLDLEHLDEGFVRDAQLAESRLRRRIERLVTLKFSRVRELREALLERRPQLGPVRVLEALWPLRAVQRAPHQGEASLHALDHLEEHEQPLLGLQALLLGDLHHTAARGTRCPFCSDDLPGALRDQILASRP